MTRSTLEKPSDLAVRTLVQKLWRRQHGHGRNVELVMSDDEWKLHVALYRRGWNDAVNAAEEI